MTTQPPHWFGKAGLATGLVVTSAVAATHLGRNDTDQDDGGTGRTTTDSPYIAPLPLHSDIPATGAKVEDGQGIILLTRSQVDTMRPTVITPVRLCQAPSPMTPSQLSDLVEAVMRPTWSLEALTAAHAAESHVERKRRPPRRSAA